LTENNNSILSVSALLSIFLILFSCKGVKNPGRPIPEEYEEGSFITVRDGIKIFVYEFVPGIEFKNTIYIVSGITGINHRSEKKIIEGLSNNKNRIVVIHPRGTGYSEGKRGDNPDLSDFIGDYIEIIKGDIFYQDNSHKIILFGHSMSCAIAIEVAERLPEVDGLILINPPVKMRPAKGMSPGILNYLKFIGYYLISPHTPVVNMAGKPSLIENEEDRRESEKRNNDPLLVKYFSMHYMAESKKIMNAMIKNARHADFPLLLLYGENDIIVDKSGCDEIYSAWKGQAKKYVIITGGLHGKSTVLRGAEIILKWIESL